MKKTLLKNYFIQALIRTPFSIVKRKLFDKSNHPGTDIAINAYTSCGTATSAEHTKCSECRSDNDDIHNGNQGTTASIYHSHSAKYDNSRNRSEPAFESKCSTCNKKRRRRGARFRLRRRCKTTSAGKCIISITSSSFSISPIFTVIPYTKSISADFSTRQFTHQNHVIKMFTSQFIVLPTHYNNTSYDEHNNDKQFNKAFIFG